MMLEQLLEMFKVSLEPSFFPDGFRDIPHSKLMDHIDHSSRDQANSLQDHVFGVKNFCFDVVPVRCADLESSVKGSQAIE